jgi:hypothetical protein
MFTGYNVNYTQVLNHIHCYHNLCLGFLDSQLETLWETQGPQGRSLTLSIVGGGVLCERNRTQTDTTGMDLPKVPN